MPDFNSYLASLKSGAKISKATADQINTHVTALNDLASQHDAMATSHQTMSKKMATMADQHALSSKMISSIAQDLTNVIGSTAYGSGDDSDTTAKSITHEPLKALATEQPDTTTVENFADLLSNELKARLNSNDK